MGCLFFQWKTTVQPLKPWRQTCGWSRGGTSSASSWSSGSPRVLSADDGWHASSWASDPKACTSYPENKKNRAVRISKHTIQEAAGGEQEVLRLIRIEHSLNQHILCIILSLALHFRKQVNAAVSITAEEAHRASWNRNAHRKPTVDSLFLLKQMGIQNLCCNFHFASEKLNSEMGSIYQTSVK